MKGYLSKLLREKVSRGFTLIELLVVIAVLGVLAAIVLLAVNPGEQLARARDTNRVSAVTQIGRSLQSYYTAHNGKYPAPASYLTTLQTSQDLKTIPTNPAGSGTTWGDCTAVTGPHDPLTQQGNQSGWCYVVDDPTDLTETIVFTGLESQLNDSKCATGQTVWWVFSTQNGRGGFTCTADALTAPTLNPTFVE
ncbi:MAG: hypothetical protein A2958_02725 [Candidatus Levybacteria bacterium RIFCSPLOWO2_01_FULL_38_13]|nr:MAG: hypothetical protein A2629_03145 [Candidatus Levybacteria bacterium RIFCSPHIGHO2_01_FULL_41_15]OGH35251.1 MAG: hypothetical protein A2958_02725 [Candidatus Levybacteria bacterium RIFCSPLOWO2_01_FULL_38_13]